MMSLVRTMFPCEEMPEGKKFPSLSEDEFAYMVTLAMEDRSVVKVFPFCRTVNKTVFIDIYIWDICLPLQYKRFIWQKDYALGKEDENLFLEYMHAPYTEVDFSRVYCLVEKVHDYFPELNLIFYQDLRHVLLHLYYGLHKSGPFELIYKSNLNYIGANIFYMEGCNLIGTSPQKILDVPLGMLRAMNREDTVEELYTEQGRRQAKDVFASFHNELREGELNKYQYSYLFNLLESAEQFSRKKFLYLGTFYSDEQYFRYLLYQERIRVIGNYKGILPQFPELYELDGREAAAGEIQKYVELEGQHNSVMQDVFYSDQKKYAYESGDYIMVIPKTVDDVLTEASNQHNCIFYYFDRILFGFDVLLFMRKKSDKNKSLVTVLLECNYLSEARQKCNQRITKEQADFLEQFCREKEIWISDMFYEDCVEGYEEWDDVG